MRLNLLLYKENKLVYSINNQEYLKINNEITFCNDSDNYRLIITPSKFIFVKENDEQKFSINYQEKSYIYYLKEYDQKLEINCTYQKYTYNKDKIIYEYLIDSDENLNKIIIELESSD